jgi:hypothetical protein
MMRCEECLAVIEEFFDGETDAQTGVRVSTHLSDCLGCAAAFDTLSEEQQLFTRYERDVEVTPALWQAVRTRIADEACEGAIASEAPLLVSLPVRRASLVARVHARLTNVLATFAPRPALAGSLALLLIVAFVGALWATRLRRTEPAAEVASNNSDTRRAPSSAPSVAIAPLPPTTKDVEVSDQSEGASADLHMMTQDNSAAKTLHTSKEARYERGVTFVLAGEVSRTRAAAAEVMSIGPFDTSVVFVEHGSEEDPLASIQPAQLDRADDVITAKAVPDSGEGEVARHVERAQTLLRSFKNGRYGEGGATAAAVSNIAYEKNLSRKLLNENLALQIEADSADDKSARQVLDALEPFLLDIANLRDGPTREEVRSIKERMRKKEIIAALQVY